MENQTQQAYHNHDLGSSTPSHFTPTTSNHQSSSRRLNTYPSDGLNNTTIATNHYSQSQSSFKTPLQHQQHPTTHQFSTPPSLLPQTGSKLLYATGMIPTTTTPTPFTDYNNYNHHINSVRSTSKSIRSNQVTPNGGLSNPTPSRSPQVISKSNQYKKEKGVSDTIEAHRSHYPTRSGKFITVIPPSDFPSDLPQNRSLPPSASASSSHVRRGTLMPLYPTLGGQLWAIAREYGLPSIGGLVIFLADDGNGNLGPKVGEATWGALWGSHFQEEEEDEEEDGSYQDYQEEREDLTEEEERMEMEISRSNEEEWNQNSQSNESRASNLNSEEVASNANSTSPDSPSDTNSSSASPDARLQRRYLSREPFDLSEGRARRAAALKAAKEAARIQAGKEEEDSDDSSDSQSTHGGSVKQSQVENDRSRNETFNPNSRNPMPYAHERQQNQSNTYINGNGRPLTNNNNQHQDPRSASNSYSYSYSQSQSQSQSHSRSHSSPASRSGSSRFASRGGGDKSNASSRRGGGGGLSKGSTSTSHSTSRQSQTRSRQSQRSNFTNNNGPVGLPIIGRIEWAVERNRSQGQWWNTWIDQAAQIQSQSQSQMRNQYNGFSRRALNSSAEDGSNYLSTNDEQDLSSSSLNNNRKENVRRSLHLLNNSHLTPKNQIPKIARNLSNFDEGLIDHSSFNNNNQRMNSINDRSIGLQNKTFDPIQFQSQSQILDSRIKSNNQFNERNSIGSENHSTRSTNLSGSDEQLGSLSQPRSSMRYSIADSRVENGMNETALPNQFAYSNRASSVLNDGYAFGARGRSEKGLSLISNSTGAVQPLSATRETFGEDLARIVKEKKSEELGEGDHNQLEGLNRVSNKLVSSSNHSSNSDLRKTLEENNNEDDSNLNSSHQPNISENEMEAILSSNSRRNSNGSNDGTPLMTKDPNSYDSEFSNPQSLGNQTLGVQGLGLRTDMNHQSSSRTQSIRSGGDSASYAGFSALMGYQGGEGENDGSAINGLSSGGGNGRKEFFESSDDDLRGFETSKEGYAALQDDDLNDEEKEKSGGMESDDKEEKSGNLPSNFRFNARAMEDGQGDEGMWRSLQDEPPSSLKDQFSGTGSGGQTQTQTQTQSQSQRQSFTPSFGDHSNPTTTANNPSLSPNSLTAHLSAVDRERERERERSGTVSPEALAVHDWIQKTSAAPSINHLNEMGDEEEDGEDEGVLPPGDDVADVLDLWARKVTSGEELPAIQEGNSYESSIHGAMAEKIQRMSANRNANGNVSQYRESLTKPPSEKDLVDENLGSSSNQQAESSLLSPIALDVGTFGGPKPELHSTDSSSFPSPRLSSSDGSNGLIAGRSSSPTQLPISKEITEEPEQQSNDVSLTSQNLYLVNENDKRPSPLSLHAPTSPGARSMTSSTDSLGDLERALELLSPVASNQGDSISNGFNQSSSGIGFGKSKSRGRPFEKMSSRDSLAAARTLSTSVTPSPRWLSKNKSISSVKLSPRPASASAVGNRPDIITSKVAASRIRTLPPNSSRELAKVGDSTGVEGNLNLISNSFDDGKKSKSNLYGLNGNRNQNQSFISRNETRDLSLPTYNNHRYFSSENGDENYENQQRSPGGIRTAYEVVMGGRPALNRKGSRNREMDEDGINSAPEGLDFSREDSVVSPISDSGRDSVLNFRNRNGDSFSKHSSPEVGIDGFAHYQDQIRSQSNLKDINSISIQDLSRSLQSNCESKSRSPSLSPTSSKNKSPQFKDENDETMVIHSQRSSMNRPFLQGSSIQPSRSDLSSHLNGSNSQPEISAANSVTHHEEGPNFRMESQRRSREVGDQTSNDRAPNTITSTLPTSISSHLETLIDQSPEARGALVAEYVQHGRDGSVASIENPTSIKRLLRGESFNESSTNGSAQVSPNLPTPVLSPTKEGHVREASSYLSAVPLTQSSPLSNAPTQVQPSEVEAAETVRGPGTASATDSDRWSQDGSEYGEESHYGASPYTAPMRLSEVSAYSRNDFNRIGNGDRGKEEVGNHTPSFGYDQPLPSNESRPTSYVPSSLGIHGDRELSAEADQSQSTSVASVQRSSPFSSIPTPTTESKHQAPTQGFSNHQVDLPDVPSGDPRTRTSTGGLSTNESVTDSLDAMLNQIDTHNFSTLPGRNNIGLDLQNQNHFNENHNEDSSDYDVMRKSTEEAVRQALVGNPNNFTHERSISRSSSQGSGSGSIGTNNTRSQTPGSPRTFSQLRSPVSPRKNSLEEIHRIPDTVIVNTQTPSIVRALSQSPRQRFKDLPPSPSLLPTFTTSPRSPNLEMSALSPRSGGSGGFDLS